MPDAASVLLRAATLDGVRTDVRVEDGTITAIGPDLAAPRGAEVVDLDGRVLLPGLWDAHVHFDQWTLGRRRLDVGPATSAAETAALVAQRLRTDPPEAGARPSTTSSAEVLPAPLTPSSANTSPGRTSKEMPRTASKEP